jgi:hypothetical protein
VVEGARLESVYRGNSIEGSNPSLSAMYFAKWLLTVEGGPFHRATIWESDNEVEARRDYQAEGGKGYRVVLARIVKAKGSGGS